MDNVQRFPQDYMNNDGPLAWAKEAGQRTSNEAVWTHQVSEHDVKLVLLYKA